MSQKTPKDEAIAQVEKLLWQIHELETTLLHYSPEGQELLEDRLSKYVAVLRDLKKLSGPLNEYRIPVDLLRHLDEGGNPDAYTADVFRQSLRINEVSKGKVVAFRQLLDKMTAQAQEAFPGTLAEYRSAVQASGQAGNP